MLADRHSRRTVLLWSAALRSAALLGAAAAAAAGAPLGVVLVFATLFTVANTAHRPAQAALTPQLARTPAELAAANVCWSTLEYAGFLAGSLAAGLIASLLPLDVGFAACAAALALTWLVLWPLPPDRRPAWIAQESPGPVAELLAGARSVWAQPEIRLLVGVYAINALAQGIIDVLIVIASFELLDLGDGRGRLAQRGLGHRRRRRRRRVARAARPRAARLRAVVRARARGHQLPARRRSGRRRRSRSRCSRRWASASRSSRRRS